MQVDGDDGDDDSYDQPPLYDPFIQNDDDGENDHASSAGGNSSFNIFLPSDAVPSAFDVTNGDGGRMMEDGNDNDGQDISIAGLRFPTSPRSALSPHARGSGGQHRCCRWPPADH